MADHERLYANLMHAHHGEPVPGELEVGWGGSHNYGEMRIIAAILEAHRIGDRDTLQKARAEISSCSVELVQVGLSCRREQCEQLAPLPHSRFSTDAWAVLLLWAVGMGCDKDVRDLAMAGAAERYFQRYCAAWRTFAVRGVVCAPAMRAKDEKGAGQWRNRPAEEILRAVSGQPGDVTYLAPALLSQLFANRRCGLAYRSGMQKPALFKLRAPIEMVRLDGGGFAARMRDTPDARKLAGKDALSAVLHTPDAPKDPRLAYDWGPFNWPAGRVEVIG